MPSNSPCASPCRRRRPSARPSPSPSRHNHSPAAAGVSPRPRAVPPRSRCGRRTFPAGPHTPWRPDCTAAGTCAPAARGNRRGPRRNWRPGLSGSGRPRQRGCRWKQEAVSGDADYWCICWITGGRLRAMRRCVNAWSTGVARTGGLRTGRPDCGGAGNCAVARHTVWRPRASRPPRVASSCRWESGRGPARRPRGSSGGSWRRPAASAGSRWPWRGARHPPLTATAASQARGTPPPRTGRRR